MNTLNDTENNNSGKLLDPLKVGIGNSMGDLWYLTFGGMISYAKSKRELTYSKKLEQFKDELEQKYDTIPEERKGEPDFQIAAQALNDSKYCIQVDELRALFVELIGNTCDTFYQKDLHPSFPDIIKQMNVLDAKILKVFKSRHTLPLVNYISNIKGNKGFNSIIRNVIVEPEITADEFHISMSISALQRWGIIHVSEMTKINNSESYDKFLETDYYRKISEDFSKEGRTVEIQKYCCSLTSFGVAFVNVCVS